MRGRRPTPACLPGAVPAATYLASAAARRWLRSDRDHHDAEDQDYRRGANSALPAASVRERAAQRGQPRHTERPTEKVHDAHIGHCGKSAGRRARMTVVGQPPACCGASTVRRCAPGRLLLIRSEPWDHLCCGIPSPWCCVPSPAGSRHAQYAPLPRTWRPHRAFVAVFVSTIRPPAAVCMTGSRPATKS